MEIEAFLGPLFCLHTNFSRKFCFLKKSLYFCTKQVDFFQKATIYLENDKKWLLST